MADHKQIKSRLTQPMINQTELRVGIYQAIDQERINMESQVDQHPEVENPEAGYVYFRRIEGKNETIVLVSMMGHLVAVSADTWTFIGAYPNMKEYLLREGYGLIEYTLEAYYKEG